MFEADVPITAVDDLDALRDLAAYYRDFYDHAPDMYLSVNAQTGTVVDCNATTVRMTGYARSELLGRRVVDLYHPACQARARQALQTFVAEGEVRGVELQVPCKDGALLDVSLSASAVRDASGAIVRSRSIWHDITAQKRTDEQLRASEAKFAALFHSSPVALHLTRMATREIVDINAAAANLLGYSREEVIGRRWSDLGPLPDGRPLLAAAGLELGKPIAVTINTRSGSSKSCLAAADAVTVDGEPCLLVTTIDITERERAAAALRAGETRLQLATRAAGLGVWHWNLADDSLEWDDRMCDLYAVPAEDRTARRYYDAWYSRLHPDDRAQAVASSSEALRTGSEWNCTFRIVLPDGGIRHIHAASVIEADEQGQPLRMVGFNQDITQHKIYEQLLEQINADLEHQVAARTAELRATVAELRIANAGKDAFLAAISHELRTPLTGILSMAELLEYGVRGPLNAEQAKYVAAIDESGRRLLETLNNIILYTQLFSGASLRRERCLLSDLSAAAVQSVRAKAERMGQCITLEVDPPDLEIVSNSEGVYHVLRMLLDNAIKFTPSGGRIAVAVTAPGGQVDPAAETAPDATGSIRIVVTDTGIGMTPDEIAGLFRLFVQADNTLARRHEGLGIGLAYVQKMAELLGGAVEVASQPEGGSRFTVSLPY